MRTSTISFLIICCLFSCNQTIIVKETGNTLIKNLYPNGIIKEIISLNSHDIKNGESFYFDEKGKMDSSVTFLNGKRNGIKNKYFSADGIYQSQYINDTIVCKKIYDSLGVLAYVDPLDVNQFAPIEAKLSNGKNYVVYNESDTLLLLNDSNIPALNTGIETIGATLNRLKSNENNIVFTTAHCKKMSEVNIIYSLYSQIGGPIIRRDTISFSEKEQ
jgi:hypothetical protein